MSRPLVEQMNAHVEELVRYYGIFLIEKKGARARAETLRVEGQRVKRIVLQPIKGRVTYFIALHEIGHHIAPRDRLRLEQEVTAWRWALDNTILEPTRAVWKHIAACLGSYIDRAYAWQNMKLPPADHDFYRLLDKAKELSA